MADGENKIKIRIKKELAPKKPEARADQVAKPAPVVTQEPVLLVQPPKGKESVEPKVKEVEEKAITEVTEENKKEEPVALPEKPEVKKKPVQMPKLPAFFSKKLFVRSPVSKEVSGGSGQSLKTEISQLIEKARAGVGKTRLGRKKELKSTDGKKKTPYEPKFFRRFSIKDLVHFSKRLAFLIRSGVPVLESLQILRKQTRVKSRGRILEVVIDDVSNGRTLSAGLARFRDSFGDFAISVVRVGEMSGTLSSNLTYLAEELQKRHTLRRKVVGALVYPAFITIATIGVTTLLTIYIFPKVMPIFTSLNVTLPFTTKVLLFVSNYLRSFGLYTLGALIVAVIALVITIRKNKSFHYFVARAILRLPVIGNLVLHYNMANFSRTLSLLLRSGFNVVEAATVTADSTPNPVYKKQCLALREHIIKGERISAFLERSPKLFPDIVCHMITIGETSGSLSDTLMYLAEHYEAEVDDMVKNLSNSIEPVLMVFMGLVVGFVAVSVITPIYEVTQHLNTR